jgi:hypothetical protein
LVVHGVKHALAMLSHEPTEQVHFWLPYEAGLFVLGRLQLCMQNLVLVMVDGAVDGIHIVVQAPRSLRESLWTNFYHAWTVASVILVSLQGHILYYSPLVLHNNEQRIIYDAGLIDELRARDMGVVHDAKFSFNLASTDPSQSVAAYFTVGPTTLTTLSAHHDDEGRSGEVARRWMRNTKVTSQMRIVAENSIERVRKWRVVSHPYRALRVQPGRYTSPMPDVFDAVMFLTNRLIIDSPCRADDWRPAGHTLPNGAIYTYSNPEGWVNSSHMTSNLHKILDPEPKKPIDAPSEVSEGPVCDEIDVEATVLDDEGVEYEIWLRRECAERDREAVRDLFHAAGDDLEAAERHRRKRRDVKQT